MTNKISKDSIKTVIKVVIKIAEAAQEIVNTFDDDVQENTKPNGNQTTN